MIRFPFYIAEVIVFLTSFVLSIVVRIKRKSGWEDAIIRWPWLLASAIWGIIMCRRAIEYGGDPPLSLEMAWWSHVIIFSGGLTAVIILWRRLCQGGR